MTTIKAAIAAMSLILSATAADACHRYSYWGYNFPQRCGVGYRPSGEVAQASPAPVPAPARTISIPVLPGPDEEALRAEAIEKLKIELIIRGMRKKVQNDWGVNR